jgi:hypothetical protein
LPQASSPWYCCSGNNNDHCRSDFKFQTAVFSELSVTFQAQLLLLRIL